LYLGIEVIFIPPSEPKRNGVVERVNGLWARAFWDKNHFSSFREVLRKSPKFLSWYQNHKPPSLGGMTVQEASSQQRLTKLQPWQIRQLPKKLPLTAGRLHFIRKVDRSGEIDILKEHWRVSKTLADNYVWATIDLCKKQLLIYGRHSLRAAPRQIRQFAYEFNEPLQCLRPEYRRRARKVDILQRI
jgi:putative transposase